MLKTEKETGLSMFNKQSGRGSPAEVVGIRRAEKSFPFNLQWEAGEYC